MAISDQELRDFINAIGETNDQNKQTLEKIESGLSVIANALTGGKGKSNNGPGNKSATETTASTPGAASASEDVADDNPSGGGKGTVLLFEDSQIEKLGESIGRHIANRGGIMGGGGEGEGAATAGGGSAADAALMAKNVRLINGELAGLQDSIRNFVDQLDTDLEEYLIRNLQNVVRDAQNSMVRYFSGDRGFEALKERLDDTLQASSRNLAGFTDSLIHDFSLTRDSFKETMRVITDNLASGGRLFALYDGNMQEFADDLRELRNSVNRDIGSFGMFNTMNIEEQNDYLGRIYQTLSAQSITDRLSTERIQNYARNQYLALEEIAQMTGLTVKELSEMNETAQVTGTELVARGFMTEDQGRVFDTFIRHLGTLSPDMLEFLTKGFIRGPGAGPTGYLDDPAALASGMSGFSDAVFSDIANGITDSNELMQRLAARVENAQGLRSVSLAALDGNLQSTMITFLNSQNEASARQENFLTAMFRTAGDLLKMFPGADLFMDITSGLFGLLGSTAVLTASINANTIAQIAGIRGLGSTVANTLMNIGGIQGRIAAVGNLYITPLQRFGFLLRGLANVTLRFGSAFMITASLLSDGYRLIQDFANIDWEEIAGRSLSMLSKGLLGVVAIFGVSLFGIPAAIVSLIAGAAAAIWFGIDAFFDGAATRFIEGVFTNMIRFISDGVRNLISGIQLMFSDVGPSVMSALFNIVESMIPDWIRNIFSGGNDQVTETIAHTSNQVNNMVNETNSVRASVERTSISSDLVAASSVASNSRITEALEEANRLNRESLEQQQGQNRQLADISNGVRSQTYDAAAVS